MSLTSGSRLGPYEILGPLGSGGMGEVYRARDTKLGREVALKILSPEFTHDPDRVARFKREAQVLASLNHPHIAQIYGFEDSGEVTALAMELVEGPTLAERIATGPVPLGDALGVARQVADALEAAHEKGIIHRDLKPANIKMTPDGQVKVLDFGLAKMAEPSASSASLSMSPTLSVHATYAGVILGTAAYMSPEQAKGKTVDKRTDIWAFGCVLFEMLTGQCAFAGEDVTDFVVAVMTKEPAWAALPASTPPRIIELLHRCLQKDARERLRDIGDARIELHYTATESIAVERKAATVRMRLPATAWILAIIVSCAAAGLGGMWLGTIRSASNPTWSGAKLGGPAIAIWPRVSPNGSLVAFHAMVDGQEQVGVMQPDSGDWTVLTHDRTRGYLSGMSWSPDGTRIYYGRIDGTPRGVFSVPAVGGEERLVLEDAGCPEVLPDGSLLVIRLNDKRQYQIYRFWPETSRQQVYPGISFADENCQMRAFRDGKEAVFYGRSAEQPDSDPENHIYALDLSAKSIRRIVADVALLRGAGLNYFETSLSVGADDRSILTWTKKSGDLNVAVQIPRGGGAARELTSMTHDVWGFDVAANGDLYIDQVSRPAEILLIEPDGGRPQTILTSDVFVDVPYAQTPDGRILFTVQVGGRKRLLASKPGGNPTPFIQTSEETSGPVTMAGSSEIAFLIGSGAARKVAIASAGDGRIVHRLEKADGGAIQALAASPDGRTLYYAAAGKIWAIPSTDGSPTFIRDGDSVAVDPHGQYLVIQLNEKDNVRLVRVPRDGGPDQALSSPGVRFAVSFMPSNAIRGDGAILKNINSSDHYPWSPVILIPATGKAQRIPLPSFLDTHFAGWTADGRVLVFGLQTNSSLWRLTPGRNGKREEGRKN